MNGNIDINIKSILGSIAIIAFLILFFGIYYKHYSPSLEVPDDIFIGAAIVFGFIISIGVYAVTDLGLIASFALGYIPAFIMLGLITATGWIFLILDILILLIMVIAYYSQEY